MSLHPQPHPPVHSRTQFRTLDAGSGASQVALVVKNPPADTGDTGDMASIPGLGRSPERGCGNPLQSSCLENPMDRGAWRARVHGVSKSWTRLKPQHTRTHRLGERNESLWQNPTPLGKSHTHSPGLPSPMGEISAQMGLI